MKKGDYLDLRNDFYNELMLRNVSEFERIKDVFDIVLLRTLTDQVERLNKELVEANEVLEKMT
jgi:hypothetical protein